MNESIDVRVRRRWTTIAPLASSTEPGVQLIIENFIDRKFLFLRPLESPVLGQKQFIPRAMFPRQNQIGASGSEVGVNTGTGYSGKGSLKANIRIRPAMRTEPG